MSEREKLVEHRDADGRAGLVRRRRHIGDFRGWKEHDAYQEAFARQLRDLKAVDSTAK